VVPDALTFAFTLVSAGTEAERAELVIEEVPAAGVCRGCGAQSEWDCFPLACRACGSTDVELVRGEELCVDALTMEEVPSGRC
jgi:hydrogenase nickel incorporation protein HypA/HybF